MQNARTQAVVFHTLRVVLIVGLFFACFFTILYWAQLMNLATHQLYGTDTGAKVMYESNLEGLQAVVSESANKLATGALEALVLALISAVALCFLARVRRYHRSLIITAAVIMACCAFGVSSGSSMVNGYWQTITRAHNLHPAQ